MIVTDERVARFVGERVGIILYPPYTSIGIERDGEIAAGLLFNCYTGPDIQVTAAGTGWTRQIFKAAGEYVFNQLGCARMEFTTEQEQVAGFVERLGGKRDGLLRDKFGKGRNGIVIGVLEQEYRFK